MAEEKEKKPMGGRREGAGRKPKSRDGAESQRVAFRCSSDVWKILQLQENKTAYIEKAIREKYRRDSY